MGTSPLASRPPSSNELGKCDVRVETLLPEAAAEDMIVASRMAGYRSKSEWLRDLILKELYGSIAKVQMLAHTRGGGNQGNTE